MKRSLFIPIFFLLILLLVGCDNQTGKSPESGVSKPEAGLKNSATGGPSDNSKILATVNGSEIRQADLDLSLHSLFGGKGAAQLDGGERDKVLKSLVMSRVIALAGEQEITPAELAAIDLKSKNYREQLFVRQYLDRHLPLQAISREMMLTYYQEHPEQFGAQVSRAYEMITSTRALSSEERDALEPILNANSGHQDWRKWLKDLQKQGYPLEYKAGKGDEQFLHPSLKSVINSLKKAEPSRVTLIQGRCYLVRVADEKERKPLPFPQVEAKVYEILKLQQQKQAIEEVSNTFLERADVKYF